MDGGEHIGKIVLIPWSGSDRVVRDRLRIGLAAPYNRPVSLTS